MARIWLPGSGGGADLDVITAGAGDVLSGKVIVDAEGNPLTGTLALTGDAADSHVLAGKTYYNTDLKTKRTGTMPDNTTTKSNGTVPGISSTYPNVPTREGTSLQFQTDTNGIKRVNLSPPKGYYNGGGTDYINRPASDFGNATAAQVLKNRTFTSENGIKLPGTMPNHTGVPQHIDARRLQNGRFEVAVAAGYHGYSWTGNSYEYMELSEVASTLGLTAAKLWPGNTVCGVASSNSNMAGGTYTPTKSKQTISCSGKAMTSNIIINEIPSNYYDVKSTATFFNNGSYGPFADLGAYLYDMGAGTWTAVSGSSLLNGIEIRGSSSSYEKYIVFKRGVDVSHWKRFVANIKISGGGKYRFYMVYKNGSASVWNYHGGDVSGSMNQSYDYSISLPSSAAGIYWPALRCHLSTSISCTVRLNSLYGYPS